MYLDSLFVAFANISNVISVTFSNFKDVFFKWFLDRAHWRKSSVSFSAHLAVSFIVSKLARQWRSKGRGQLEAHALGHRPWERIITLYSAI